jgi:hypothetical protein
MPCSLMRLKRTRAWEYGIMEQAAGWYQGKE